MQIRRRTELLQVLKVTTAGSHVLGEVFHRPVDVFLWQLFPDGLQGNFHSVVWDLGCQWWSL